MQDFSLQLAPNVESVLTVDGDYFIVQECDSPIELLFDESGTWAKRYPGQGNAVEEYQTVKIRSRVRQNVRISLGHVGNAAPVQGGGAAGGGGGDVTAQFEGANLNTGLPVLEIGAGQTTQVVAANRSRLSLRLSIPADSPGPILVASNVQAGAGVGGLLEPGITDYIGTSGQLSAHNPNDETVTVYALELERI